MLCSILSFNKKKEMEREGNMWDPSASSSRYRCRRSVRMSVLLKVQYFSTVVPLKIVFTLKNNSTSKLLFNKWNVTPSTVFPKAV